MKKLPLKNIIILLVLVGGTGFGFLHWMQTRNVESTDDAAIEAHIIPIAPKIAGYVVELNIKDNQHVKKGDILLKIDPEDYQIALKQAQADLAVAQSRLIAGQHNYASTSVSAPSNLTSAESQVAAATAEWKNAQTTLKRLQDLGDAARSRQSLDNAIADEKSARSNLADANAKLKSAQTAPDAIAASEAGVKELQAAVEKADAVVAQAQKNLDDTVLVATEDGRVTRRNIEQGAYVKEGQQLFTIVSDEIWIVANFKETQLEYMKPGQNVDIEIDAYPGQDFTGKVDSIQSGTGARFSLFPPENATGNFVKIVQRVPVKIVFDKKPSDTLSLGAGMSVTPKVHVQ